MEQGNNGTGETRGTMVSSSIRMLPSLARKCATCQGAIASVLLPEISFDIVKLLKSVTRLVSNEQ